MCVDVYLCKSVSLESTCLKQSRDLTFEWING